MGSFKKINGEITIEDGVDFIQFSATDAERCIPWVGNLPAAMVYTQNAGPQSYRLDKAIESIDRIREIILDDYWGLTLAQARARRKTEIMEQIRDAMLAPKRLFEMILPAIMDDAGAKKQLDAVMSMAKTRYQAAAAAIDEAETIPAIKAIGIEL